MGIGVVPLGWGMSARVRQYTIKGGDRTYVLLDWYRLERAALAMQVGQKIDFRIEGKKDHHERNHQGLENRLIIKKECYVSRTGAIQHRQRLGGMLNYYYRQAA
jgi:hypothetical protein